MLTLEANYSKKIGLPQYSSHQFSVTIRSEVADIRQVEQETSRMYSLLQSSVDREIQQVGFLPDGNAKPLHIGTPNGTSRSNQSNENWGCTVAQKNLILKIAGENNVPLSEIDATAKQRFEGTSLHMLNTAQASALIKELLDRYPSKNGNGQGRPQRAGWRRAPIRQ